MATQDPYHKANEMSPRYDDQDSELSKGSGTQKKLLKKNQIKLALGVGQNNVQLPGDEEMYNSQTTANYDSNT
jgi:hypothetical protein